VVVQNEELALVYNTVSREFDRNQVPLQQGRYVLKPGQVIYTFQRVYQLVSMEGDNAVSCTSSDGLTIYLYL